MTEHDSRLSRINQQVGFMSIVVAKIADQGFMSVVANS